MSSKMYMIPRLLCGILVLLVLVTYNTILSFVLLFVPGHLRKKKDIKGQRVLITGAGSGVGRELALEFSKHATCLILVDINRESLLQTEKLLDRCSSVFVYDCDVSDYKKVYAMADQVRKDAGDVDILVNNAGVVSGNYLCDLPEKKIVQTMGVNALAHFWTCKAFLPAMMKKNSGHIVSVVSIAGKTGGPRVTDYCASKFAALGFAESLELEMRHKNLDGIKVTTVCPSVIDTHLFKGADLGIGSKMSPAYVAKEVVSGVLENEEMIILPFYFKYMLLMNQLLPRWIMIRVHKILGTINAMDNFVGRGQSENASNGKEEKKE